MLDNLALFRTCRLCQPNLMAADWDWSNIFWMMITNGLDTRKKHSYTEDFPSCMFGLNVRIQETDHDYFHTRRTLMIHKAVRDCLMLTEMRLYSCFASCLCNAGVVTYRNTLRDYQISERRSLGCTVVSRTWSVMDLSQKNYMCFHLHKYMLAADVAHKPHDSHCFVGRMCAWLLTVESAHSS